MKISIDATIRQLRKQRYTDEEIIEELLIRTLPHLDGVLERDRNIIGACNLTSPKYNISVICDPESAYPDWADIIDKGADPQELLQVWDILSRFCPASYSKVT